MSPAAKAMMVVVGLFFFCGISVLGPIFGDASEFATSTILGQSAHQEVRNKQRATNDKYKASTTAVPVLLKAADCCEQAPCSAQWDYVKGQCNLATKSQNASFQACLAK